MRSKDPDRSAEASALLYGMGWTASDLRRPQVMIESVAGSSHPCSAHLHVLAEEAGYGVLQAGGRPAHYTVTDICDGVAQGHEGMKYPLASRELIADMVEIHARAGLVDALVLVSAGDKAVPAHLQAMARLDLPAVHVPGGAMATGPALRSAEELWTMAARRQEGRTSGEEYEAFERFACPGCGACQYMGTAATMQVLAEALGVALPWSALVPVSLAEIRRAARSAGEMALGLWRDGVGARSILTKEAFENAITVHAAIGGSLNAVMHLVAVATEAGIGLSAEDFDAIHQDTPVLVDAKTAGRYPTELFWYAGGVPRLMASLRERLHLDALTVSGATLGENLERVCSSHAQTMAAAFLGNYGIGSDDVIRPTDDPAAPPGSTALLSGSLATGALVKAHAVAATMRVHTGPVRAFDSEPAAVRAVAGGEIAQGDVVVVRYQGPRAAGMPELFKLSEAIASAPALAATTALVTDGRFSGATRGPCIGYVYPEAIEGGPIALLQDGDLLHIDIPGRALDIVGLAGARASSAQVRRELSQRRSSWRRPTHTASGALAHYSLLAEPGLRGGMCTTRLAESRSDVGGIPGSSDDG